MTTKPSWIRCMLGFAKKNVLVKLMNIQDRMKRAYISVIKVDFKHAPCMTCIFMQCLVYDKNVCT